MRYQLRPRNPKIFRDKKWRSWIAERSSFLKIEVGKKRSVANTPSCYPNFRDIQIFEHAKNSMNISHKPIQHQIIGVQKLSQKERTKTRMTPNTALKINLAEQHTNPARHI